MPGVTRCSPKNPQRAATGNTDFVPRSHEAAVTGLRKAGFGAYCHVRAFNVLTEMMPSTAGVGVKSRVMSPNARAVGSAPTKTLMHDSTREAVGKPGNWLKLHGTVLMFTMFAK